MFSGFTPQSLQLLRRFRDDNTHETYEACRSAYEKVILEPSRDFVVEMGEHLQALVPTIEAQPKVNGSLFRILRDSRFHRSEPLKEHIGFVFWQGRGKRMESSSFYFHFDPEQLFFAAGMRRFKPPMLAAYRKALRDPARREALHAILTELLSRGYHLPQPRYKRYPPGFDAGMPHAYLALFDCMYAYQVYPPEGAFFSDALPAFAYDLFEPMLPLQQWVYQVSLEL